ncbi:MAG TPA: pyridoxine 5'-phosphate synthase [Candidatus Binataceae bacterium]|nr:pyridoxine 5'-phosphate synthase [Candidatus Binataceae bacterium]
MIRLSVNVNKIAVLRNSRGGTIPDVLTAARTCIAAGCHGITVHPRPDARHIMRQDVLDLSGMLKAEFKRIEFNIEGYPSPEFIELVGMVKPTQCTLVPDPPGVLTSNAGWQLGSDGEWLRPILKHLADDGIRTSLFVEPDATVVERARELGAARIELFTGPYATAFGTPAVDAILGAHRATARLARKIGLGVNAGHDLDLRNIPRYAAAVKGLQETSIGHALIADALYLGLTRSVKAYLKALGSKPSANSARRTDGGAKKG